MLFLSSGKLILQSKRLNLIYLRVFAREVVEKVLELDEEKKNTEKAFHDFLPQSVVRDLKDNKVQSINNQHPIIFFHFVQETAENFDCVTIFFGDIIGFNALTADCSAVEVDILNKE